MKIIELRDEWSAISTLLDQVLELPDEKRPAWFASLSALDVQYRATLIDLLGRNRLELIDEMPVFQVPKGADREDRSGAAAGQLVGPYRLIELLGHGGMGSVWLAERADAQPRRKVALKLPHLGWGSGMMARIARERDILASLEHPNIARLYDAGVDQRGRPYLALEYVDGVPIDEYCATHRLALDERLRLLLLAAAAVSYAHTRLVVHRDLKPSNILVTQSGDVRLLDFGIAKLIQDDADEVTHVAGRALTPDYSSPEQIHGQPIGTPSDVYSFGVVAYELLAQVRPYRLKDLHAASLSEAIMRVEAALPSRAAVSPTLRRELRGDLDAILNKALKKDPAQRYPTVSSFAADVERYLEHSPVTARPDDFIYRWRKFIARNAVQAAAAAVVICAILVGATAALWQAHQARTEAARAAATKNFLLSVFRANDPHIASDKPRGEITARELLDLGAPRIEKEFAGQPELQIELLGLTADIYNNLADEERYAAVQRRRMELARAYYGSAHPIVIAGLLEEADAACERQDFVKADRLLAELDGLLKTSGLDHSVARADWWRTKARVYGALDGDQPNRADAMGKALALYAETAPHSSNYAMALSMAARDYSERGEHLKAKQLLEQGLAVAQAAPQRDDAVIANLFNNLARKQENLGEFVAAEDTYQRAEDMARKTYGERHPYFWLSLAYHARLLHQRGQRARSDALFAQMLQTIPQTWKRDISDKWAREIYAECMAADGRAGDAVPLLESALRSYLKQVLYEYDVREVRRKLGDAYDRVGRTADARRSLQAARDEFLAKEGPTSQWTLRSQERWGRFLLDHSRPGDADFAAAAAEFQTVVARAAGRPLLESALAHAGLARIASQQGDTPHALNESSQAVALLTKVQGLYDLRAQPQLWLVHSAVLFKSGDSAAARTWAEKALQASLRYDEPSSPAIAEARAAVRLAAPRGPKGTLAASFCGPSSSSGSCN